MKQNLNPLPADENLRPSKLGIFGENDPYNDLLRYQPKQPEEEIVWHSNEDKRNCPIQGMDQ